MELKEMIESIDQKVTTMLSSLKNCQSRCIVDNPPSRWRALGQAIVAVIKL